MNSVKGFMAIAALENNASGVVAAFGELSTRSETFSKQKGRYSNTTSTNVELVTFKNVDGDGLYFALPNNVRDHVLQVGEWVYDQYAAGLIPTNTNKSVFISSLETEFSAMGSIVISQLLAGNTSQYNMPDFIQWAYTDSVTSTEYTFKVWFSDSAFQGQYDEYEIIVIPPLSNIDLLNGTSATVAPLLTALGFTAGVAAMQTAIGNNPPTLISTKQYTWHDPVYSVSTLPTNWGLVIYGAAGNSADNIRQAVKDYIAAHTALTLSTWGAIYPDIYSENEFVIVPLWDNIAAPDTQLEAAIYSPIAKVSELKGIATDAVPDSYASAVVIGTYLDINLQVASTFWRSASFLAIGNPNNQGSVYEFSAKFPDYMNIPSTSPDFARMETDTQDFVTTLSAALEHARTMEMSSSVPVGFSRVIRDGDKLYLAFDHGGTTYLILTKYGYNTIFAG